MNLVKKSTLLSAILRHEPSSFGLSISKEGWVSVSDIINNVNELNSLDILQEIVNDNNKKRYAFNEDKTLIRALQGHSIKSVNIDLEKVILTKNLFHGTHPKNVESILIEGLKPMTRLHVHLSKDEETAKIVGKRHSKKLEPVILVIDKNANNNFYISENGVYLANYVEPQFISLLK